MRVEDLGRLAWPNWPMPSASSSSRWVGSCDTAAAAAAGGAMVDIKRNHGAKKAELPL